MSRPAPRLPLSKRAKKLHRQKAAPPARQPGKKHFMLFVIIAVLAAIPFSMGKYFELNYPDPYDSGGNVYSAKHILDGARIGIEEKPSAALGTLLVNILGVWLLGFNETGPKLIQGILQAAALILMFCAMRKLFGTLAAAAGVIITSVYISAPLIAKFGNVKEQYMIAFMVMGISCLVLQQLGGRWWYAMLAGAFVSWGPLFKETGVSAIAAVGIFVIAGPVFRNRTLKQAASDAALLAGGAMIAIAPLYIWIIGADVQMTLPYAFVWQPAASVFAAHQTVTEPAAEKTNPETDAEQGTLIKFLPDYARRSWQMLKPQQRKEVAVRVFRYYLLLILPVALAAGAIAARVVRLILKAAAPQKIKPKACDRFVLLFAVWWLLDMALIWVSPRSYEQYYLPLNASGAMLGGYLIGLYSDKTRTTIFKDRWIAAGLAGLLCMVVMSWHIFFGIRKSPHSGTDYGQRQRGYAQKFDEISDRKTKNARGAWEAVGEYIRLHSEPSDKIYVWGWYPGIYVKAQRLSCVPSAFTSEMNTLAPADLAKDVQQLVDAFEKDKPKFLVDTYNIHFPWDRPPLELWPKTPGGFLPPNKEVIDRYDAAYSKILHDKIEPAQGLRYEAMKPLRDFVMGNYKIVRSFGEQVVFELKNPTQD